MAAAFIFPDRNVFSLGNHGFYPIVDRVRAAATLAESEIIEPIVRPTDEGFDFLNLDADIEPRAFRSFFRIASREHARCVESNDAAKMHPDYYNGIMTAWSELLRRISLDPRCESPDTD